MLIQDLIGIGSTSPPSFVKGTGSMAGPPPQIHRNREVLQRESSRAENSNNELFKEQALEWLHAVTRHLVLMWSTPRLTWAS